MKVPIDCWNLRIYHRLTSNYDDPKTPDMFDIENSVIAQNFETMMSQSAETHRQQIMQQMAGQGPGSDAAPSAVPAAAPVLVADTRYVQLE